MNPGSPEEQTTVLRPGTMTIGRTKDNHIVCMHKSLSRKHAQLEVDGTKVHVTDLQSKNGIFFNGRRVPACDLIEGDSFRCGDITFLLEGATTAISRGPKMSMGAQTLPSPIAFDSSLSKRVTKVPPPGVIVEDDHRYKEKLFLLIRASELLVGEIPIDKLLDELVVLGASVLEVDRIALLTLDESTLEMFPKVLKTFMGASARPYSKRVVDWVVDHGTPMAFGDVSRDSTIPGDMREDVQVRAAMAAPINPGGGTIGVLYADSVSTTNVYRPDDLALFRALANIAAVAMDSDALRQNSRESDPGMDDEKTRIPI